MRLLGDHNLALTLEGLITKMNNPNISKERYEFFKEYLQKEYPNLSLWEIIEIYHRRDVIGTINGFIDSHRLMQLLEFDMEKSNLDSI
jgi:hypothetical protein